MINDLKGHMKKIILSIAVAALALTACQKPVELPKGNETIVYQVNEKIFSANESFKAVDARLDEIESLGVNVLWLMPIHPIGIEKTANSPYCVRDFKDIKAEFGTLDDLKTLVNHAHAKGMRVILDWIANHAAFDNPWAIEHPEWFTGPVSRPEMWWGDVTFFDYDNHPAAREAMVDAMTYWMTEAGIDGFRCDYAEGLTDSVWALIINDVRAVNPDALMLAETSRYELYDAGFDWLYSWDYLGRVQRLYRRDSLSYLYEAHDKEVATTPEGKMRLRYVTNHDACSEHASRECYETQQGLLAASCLTYFLGGVPLIYSSQEIGYMESINFCVPSEHSVLMDWSENPETYAAFQQMMKIYKETAALRVNAPIRVEDNESVAVLCYSSEAGQMLVVVNISDAEQEIAIPEQFVGGKVKNLLTDKKVAIEANCTLAPYEYVIYTK